MLRSSRQVVCIFVGTLVGVPMGRISLSPALCFPQPCTLKKSRVRESEIGEECR